MNTVETADGVALHCEESGKGTPVLFVETAQKRIEQRNYTIRKHTLEYDDVMNKQRKEVYAFRNEILFSEIPLEIVHDILHTAASHLIGKHPGNSEQAVQELSSQFPVNFESLNSALDLEKSAAELVLTAFEKKLVHQRETITSFRPDINDAEKAQNVLQEVLRNLIVRKCDQLWQEHLLGIDHLRSDVHMRTVGQKDPLLEFKHESFALFEKFSEHLRLDIARDFFRFEMMPQSAQQRLQQQLAMLQKGKPRPAIAREGG